jgi:hypothetical protein
MPDKDINTGGGSYIEGDVNPGKDFIGRDFSNIHTNTQSTVITNKVSGNTVVALVSIVTIGAIACLTIILFYRNNTTNKIFVSSQIADITFGVLLAILLVLGVLIIRDQIHRFNVRHIQIFWKPFFKSKVEIVISEYPPQPRSTSSASEVDNLFSKYWRSRWLISKGMAVALAHLLEFCGNQITSRDKISIIGSYSGHPSLYSSNFIVLGSVASNRFTQLIFQLLESLYDLPYKFSTNIEGYQPEEKGIWITSDNLLLEPTIDATGFGHDYGVIIKAKYRHNPDRWVIVAAGCHMWGTEAAAVAITRAEIIGVIAQYVNLDNFAFIIKTDLINSRPMEPNLHINGRYYVSQLIAKNAHR